ncbi:SEC-C metal-binding domain-containing protein [Paenibacillus tarimensis]
MSNSVKIGRNDPCHCGSGKKYKKCCLESDAKLKSGDLDIHELISTDLEWNNPLYQIIATSIVHSLGGRYPDEFLLQAVSFWHKYSSAVSPVVRKPQVACAAVEYLMSEAYGLGITQAELADRYNISAASISSRYQDMLEFSYSGEFPSDEDWEQEWDEADQFEPDFVPGQDPEAYIASTLPALKKRLEHEERKLDKQLFVQDKGHFWLIRETRDYMQAKYQYAQSLWLSGQAAEAAKELDEIIELNNMDNLGARFLLLPAYLELRRFEEAEQLLEAFHEDASASFAYDRLILEYLKKGVTPSLKLLFRSAKKQNPHVPDYLFGRKPFPDEMPDFIGFGDENEAIEYIAYHSRLWVQFPDLLKWMMEEGN